MRAISKMRFDALAGYCRQPQTVLFGQELSWFEHGGERVLGVLIRDYADNDYGGMVLGRDARGRFRWVGAASFKKSKSCEIFALRKEMKRLAALPDEEFFQGDEKGKAIDFLTPVEPADKLNSSFKRLSQTDGFSPAREIIKPMMNWYEDPDGNFVQQFQTTGFDSRMWELYLFATFVEMGYAIDRVHAVPDFCCTGLFGSFCVEAATVNATQAKGGAIVPPPPTTTPEEIRVFNKQYMPIKYGSVLTSKLAKRYWEAPAAEGKPLVIAIHDFHAPASMIYTRSALPIYLYGYNWDAAYSQAGELVITPRKIEFHEWGKKKVPSGFFDLEGSQNISAIVFSNSGTISKFNRMGFLAKFGSRRVQMIRRGTAYNHAPNASEPLQFALSVNDRSYQETWTEGLEVYHNPRASRPIEIEMMPGAVHHHIRPDGQLVSTGPDWQPLGSVTFILMKKEE
jgi:hypothetical protein